MSVAFQLKSPFKNKHGFNSVLVTIWHHDPCTDGTDDSCGWFMRSRHGNQEHLEQIKKKFSMNWDNDNKEYVDSWFDMDGRPRMSVIGTALEMYSAAAWVHFGDDWRKYRKHRKFMKDHLYDIMRFSENCFDSLHGLVVTKNPCKPENKKQRIAHFASIIYGDVLRMDRKWWQHPKWHVNHWDVQFDFVRNIMKRFKRKKKSGLDRVAENANVESINC